MIKNKKILKNFKSIKDHSFLLVYLERNAESIFFFNKKIFV